jgi:hypothetical protein
MRLLTTAGVLLLTTGCYDFEGDYGALGFTSDATVGWARWTPEAALADGTSVRVTPVTRVGKDDQEPLDLRARARGDAEVVIDGASVTLTAWGGDASVTWRGDATDRVRASWRPVADVTLEGALDRHFQGGTGDGTVRVMRGAVAALAPVLRDASGAPLGYHPDALGVIADGDAEAWIDSGVVFVAASGDGALTITLDGDVVGAVGVADAHPSDVDTLRVDAHPQGDDAFLVRASAWDEHGNRLYGVAPRWSGGVDASSDEHADLAGAPAGATVEARLDGVDGGASTVTLTLPMASSN